MPLHPSVARIAASRANGARSKGPVTARGKARASLNAVKHGLRGRRVVLRDDGERAAFAALLEGLEARCAPVDACERHWVHELATVMWRQQRLEALELAVLQQAGSDDEDGPRLPSLRTLCRYRARLARDWRAAFDALAGLRALRPRPVGDLEPAQLRWLADQAEAKRAAKAEAADEATETS